MIEIPMRIPHRKQREFLDSPAKRKVIRAGRRSGKTTGIAIYAAEQFIAGRRVLYASPTSDQIGKFWRELIFIFHNAIKAKHLKKNETLHVIERPNTENAIRAKTAWNADTLRGDYADVLIFDEWQLMNEDAWGVVGAPMLLDNDGDAVFIYTPPSARSRSTSKATDKQHAAKLYKKAKKDKSGRWAAFHFSSHDNPHISDSALSEITTDMTSTAYRQEILAEDLEETPGSLWKRATLDKFRIYDSPSLVRVVVGVDPAVTANIGSDETGIIVAGKGEDNRGYVLSDCSTQATPAQWAQVAIDAYYDNDADVIVAEVNNGGDMVRHTIHTIDPHVPVIDVRASRGKYTRAQPISAKYENGVISHVGNFPDLEDQLCTWQPGDKSPDRLDALVWTLTELVIQSLSYAFPAFSECNTSNDMTYNKSQDIYCGIYEGYSEENPRCAVLIQMIEDKVYVLDEYIGVSEQPESSIDNIISMCTETPALFMTGNDPKELRHQLRSKSLYNGTTNHKLSDGIKVIQRYIGSGDKDTKLIINSKCERLIEQIRWNRFKDDDKPLDEDNQLVKALSYILWNFR
jgi:phage terminase large subunit-like protein